MQAKAKQTKRTRSYLHKLQKEAVTHTATPNDAEKSPSNPRAASIDSLLSARSLVDKFENLHRLKHVPLTDVRITQIREKLEEIMPEVYKRTNTLKSSTREKNIKDFAEGVLLHFPDVDLDAMRPKVEAVREAPQLHSNPGSSSSSLGFAVSSTFNNLRDLPVTRKHITSSPSKSNLSNASSTNNRTNAVSGTNENIESTDSGEFSERHDVNSVGDFNVHNPGNNVSNKVNTVNTGNASNKSYVGNTANLTIAGEAVEGIDKTKTDNTLNAPPSVHNGPNPVTHLHHVSTVHGNPHVGRVTRGHASHTSHGSHAGISGHMGTCGVQMLHIPHSTGLARVNVSACSSQQNVSSPPMYHGVVGPQGLMTAEQHVTGVHNETSQALHVNVSQRDRLPNVGMVGVISGAIGMDGRGGDGSMPSFSGSSNKFMEMRQGISSPRNVTISQRALMCAVHDVSEGPTKASRMLSEMLWNENEGRWALSPAGISPAEVELMYQSNNSEGRFGLGMNME